MRGRRDRRQRSAIAHPQLAQQAGNVTAHGTTADEQPRAVLGIRQVFGNRGQHLSLAGRHPTCDGTHRFATLRLRNVARTRPGACENVA
jgi:hypothetical protein